MDGKYDIIKIRPKIRKKMEKTSMVVSAEADEPEPELNNVYRGAVVSNG